MKPLLDLAADLAAGRVRSRDLVEECLARIADETGEGGRTFLKVYAETAPAMADAMDQARELGMAPTPFSGIPISIKDIYDVAGDVTLAGSKALVGSPPATADCPAVARLRAAGFVIVGRTTLSEFAFSGVGLNYHHGTPKNPWDRETGRAPGGSSSGAAVSVTDGMCAMGLGTDTGGSIRIPAALCGIAGFKPSTGRIPTDGVFPLAPSLDSVGPLAQTVACCAITDAILAGEPPVVPEPLPVDGLRLAVPQTVVLDDLEDVVARDFEAALDRLSKAGARITDVPFDDLAEIREIDVRGGIIVAQAYAGHRQRLAASGDLYDPWIRCRMERGADISAADYIEFLDRQADLIRRAARVTAPFDAIVAPTVARTAPAFTEVETRDDFISVNGSLLRNTNLFNFLDRCAMSLPCHEPGHPPVGFMAVGEHGDDRRLLALAGAIEPVVRL